MEAKVDIRKLQLLNDRINQLIDAVNQVRLSVHGLQPSLGVPSQIGAQLGYAGQAMYPQVAYDPYRLALENISRQMLSQQMLPFGQLTQQASPYAQVPFAAQFGGFGAQLPFSAQMGGFGTQLPFVAPNPWAQQIGAYGAQNPWTQQVGGIGGQQVAWTQQPSDPFEAARIQQTFPHVLSPNAPPV